MNAKNISEILDALAQRFGATGAHLWGLIVRQQYVESILGFTFAALTIVAWILAVRWYRRQVATDKHFDTECATVIYGGIGLVVCGLIAAILFFVSLATILNPEYAALHDLAKMFGGAR